MHLQSIYPPSGRYGGAGAFGFHPEAHLTESSPLVSDANRRKLIAEWSPYWDLRRTHLLEKSPPNLIRTRFLQAMFPNSSFIVVLRHPVAVTYATQQWYRRFKISFRRFSRILEHWLVCHEIFRGDEPHLRRTCIIRYEEFVADPQAQVDGLCAFLGLESFPVGQDIIPATNDKYFQRWRRRVASPRSVMARALVRRLEARTRQFGYSLEDLDWIGGEK